MDVEAFMPQKLRDFPVWPFYNLGLKIREVRGKLKQPPIDLGQGEPDFDTPQHIKDAMIEALRQGYTGYSMNPGIAELREAIAEKLERDNGIDVKPSQVIVTFGASEAILLTMLGLLDPGDEVVITDPSYVSFGPIIEFCGGRVLPVPLKEEENYQLDISALESMITPKTKIIFLNTPNNPTGTVLTKDSLDQIAEIAKRRNLLVVTDEVYEKFLYEGARHYSIASFPGMAERTITINGFSKAYAMTGWRAGYMAGPEEIIDRLIRIHAFGFVCINTAVQKACVAALRGPQGCVREMLAEYTARREVIVDRLSRMPGVKVQKPRGAFYVFPNVEAYNMPSWDLSFHIIDHAGVITTPGAPFGATGEGHLRISYAASMENIVEGMNRIEGVLEDPLSKT
ncbi:MAG: pyridoxal phosphate-dependent aminotransferase [Candidatus Bathyarchaeia archaeon]